MPLNKLENFIKNTEGRILYVNPNDLDATDSISNSGNSLTKPFKTIQRALIESARFSYVRGVSNDKNDQTTILLFPGEHIVDNRPGYGIVDQGGTAKAFRPSDGTLTDALTEFDLNLETNFDLTQEENILYKFNSIHGGVIVPRGTSIVGLDLRKTKIRPKYVPNPTDPDVKRTAIFRITGNCYFWQFTILDGNEQQTVYTDPTNFSDIAKPTFSHHKLTVFEYCDGLNVPRDLSSTFTLTDLDMYYAKLSNAYNTGSVDKNIDFKYPDQPLSFAKERPEYEIVSAFATDPLRILNIFSGDGATPSSVITVETAVEHNLTTDTPIKIDGVGQPGSLSAIYNVSTKVQAVLSATKFTYVIPSISPLLPASPAFTDALVTVETDSVKGGSPYIFNCSMRSVWGMNGLLADGNKATGFRSMVTAQFTGVSLQKDDRAFIKYNESSRTYDSIAISKVTGDELSTQSSSTNPATVYHLDSSAIYRPGWDTRHISADNDGFVQVVSVFAIGFNIHFFAGAGGDNSITNSNSNFGQISLVSDGFKKAAFDKDDSAYITSIIPPKSVSHITDRQNIDWFPLDVGITTSVGISSHLYLFGFNSSEDIPPIISQGFRIGAKKDDKLYVNFTSQTGYGISEASIYMVDNEISSTVATVGLGTTASKKKLDISGAPTGLNGHTFTTPFNHNFVTGESVRILSESGDVPENLTEHTKYYVIKISDTQFKVASSPSNAINNIFIRCYLGTDMYVESRISDKVAGEAGAPVQFDPVVNRWYIHVNADNEIYTSLDTLGVAGIGTARSKSSFVKRFEDTRSLEDKIYKVRVVIPRESTNAKNPEDTFAIQESSSTNTSKLPVNSDFTISNIDSTDVHWNRNPRFISTCSATATAITVSSEQPHGLKDNDTVIIEGVTSSDNSDGEDNLGFNGVFDVTSIIDDKTFTIPKTDNFGVFHTPTTFSNDTSQRTVFLPRLTKNNLKTNYYIYRKEIISEFIKDIQDGIYHLYVIKADKAIDSEYTYLKYSQNVVNLFPELDRDNPIDNPPSARSFAKRDPIGEVVTNDLSRSITKESIDTFVQDFSVGLGITNVIRDDVAGIATVSFDRQHALAGIVSCILSVQGTGYTPASGTKTYYNVKVFDDSDLTIWNGATAEVKVTDGSVVGVDIQSGGSYYLGGFYYLDDAVLGGTGTQATINAQTDRLQSPVGNVVQTTGIGSISDGYFSVVGVGSTNVVSVAVTAGDPMIAPGQYMLQVGPGVAVSTSAFDSGVVTITSTSAHGLVAGNQFRIVDNSNNNLGDYFVNERVGVNTFTFKSSVSISGNKILKHGLSANNGLSGSNGENLSVRLFSMYGNETAILSESLVGVNTFRISSAGIATENRFKIGDYIQVDEEIMRISSPLAKSTNELSVIRGYFGTLSKDHQEGSLIKKLNILPVEFRRPSIQRASGHTFEYLGFGPGNYSTGLPQVQTRTLTEVEDLLSQSQERACGIVVYTGMNNNGDFYIGNKRVSPSTGEEKTFDAPIPTITGEDASRLSVIFDEVIIKERLKVEGGQSKQILSQFDGPVSFNNDVKIVGSRFDLVGGDLTITSETESTTSETGAIVVEGGVGIGGTINVAGEIKSESNLVVTGTGRFGDDVVIKGTTQSTNKDTGSLIIEGGVGIEKNLNVGGAVDVEGDFNIQGALTVGGIGSGNLQVDGAIIAGEFQTGNLGIGTVNDNTINTTTGDLNLNTTGTGRIKLNANTDITGELNVTGDITAFHTSDSRMKHHPVRLERMREAIRKITGYHYTWNQLSDKDGQHDIGVLAQEVEGLGLPGITTTRDDGYLAVNYQKLVPVLIQTIKEMDVELSRLSDVVGSVESQSRRFSNLKHIEQMRADIYFIMRWISEKEGELPEYFTSISELEQ